MKVISKVAQRDVHLDVCLVVLMAASRVGKLAAH